MPDINASVGTRRAAKDFTRRSVLKGAAYSGAAVSVAPFIGRRAFGQSSGEVRVFA